MTSPSGLRGERPLRTGTKQKTTRYHRRNT